MMMQTRVATSSTLRSAVGAVARPLLPQRVMRRSMRAAAKTESSGDAPEVLPVAIAGLISNPIMLFSEYLLKTTGEGFPVGPGGAYGAAEGVSYLVVVGIVLWSLKTKFSTGSGLPAGPNGLLGAAEGLSYLTALAGIIVAVLVIQEQGSLPGLTGR